MKKALLVGINYTHTFDELRGGVNDALNVGQLLVRDHGFNQVRYVTDRAATVSNIIDALHWLTYGAQPGDVLLFYFSGHGTQVRSTVEPDALDEVICPIDTDWHEKVITDNQLNAIFDPVPNGTNITVILDCCHSGSGLDQNRTLYDSTGQLKPRYRRVPSEMYATFKRAGMEVRHYITSRDVNRSALLIAASRPEQASVEALIDGQYQGAATYSLLLGLKAGKKTYRELVEFMTDYMVQNGYAQRPQLDGHPSLYDQAFLEPWGVLFNTVTETPEPGTWLCVTGPTGPTEPTGP